jgi:glycerol uptake facilitator-like aquaporin
VSGGHFNPAVSFMMVLSNKIDIAKFVAFVIAQLLGGTAALIFHTYTK